MTRRQAWISTFVGSALFWAGLGLVGYKALAAEPTERTVIPFIEFNCKGISDVMLTQDGMLTAGGKIYKLSHGYLNQMVFSGGVILEGEIEGDALYFDRSTLRIGGQSYTCRAE